MADGLNVTADSKAKWGRWAYAYRIIQNIRSGLTFNFKVDIDDGKKVYEKLTTHNFDISNARLTIGEMVDDPLTWTNDGLMELFHYDIPDLAVAGEIENQQKAGGCQVYNRRFTTYRCQKVKIQNLNYDDQGKIKPNYTVLDGEEFTFVNSLTIECLREELEVIGNLDKMYRVGYDPSTVRKAPKQESSSGGWICMLCCLLIIGAIVAAVVLTGGDDDEISIE